MIQIKINKSEDNQAEKGQSELDQSEKARKKERYGLTTAEAEAVSTHLSLSWTALAILNNH